ncbi:MAG TPA: hypothetical protein VFW84_06875 [Aquabacterium sp.]|uniref:hypothetical protein n=1 Tax=Aquabacterium sp. TaxID=1872578 RepID=UPI002E3618D8|nr:hypothetical protein [Aquabacterium sp.]HEX5372442.1 hypothetical protein [Aquabacterium sp.]
MSVLSSARMGLSILSLSILAACGGGGDSGSGADESSITVHTATSATSAGTYRSSSVDVVTDNTDLGPADSVEIDFGSFEGGSSAIQSDNDIYLLGFSDASGDYVCGSPLASEVLDAPPCPEGTVVDTARRTARFTNAVLTDVDSSNTVRISGTYHW